MGDWDLLPGRAVARTSSPPLSLSGPPGSRFIGSVDAVLCPPCVDKTGSHPGKVQLLGWEGGGGGSPLLIKALLGPRSLHQIATSDESLARQRNVNKFPTGRSHVVGFHAERPDGSFKK